MEILLFCITNNGRKLAAAALHHETVPGCVRRRDWSLAEKVVSVDIVHHRIRGDQHV